MKKRLGSKQNEIFVSIWGWDSKKSWQKGRYPLDQGLNQI
ncbi:hypothetical protein P872_15220 [Rhodonellum psychrophilum GCM71 = DSM 17998]|uniref:Uncharacterized protein n=1 Tax=Rhodonellum psychrophilum GCM71 = DSM 17998 TaxID=1123057 RepID=U5C7D9_9BACT|nr:hypothetical protein P872_15220 [Rhodonellum psychrophilum GCM71 = DSM 17998]